MFIIYLIKVKKRLHKIYKVWNNILRLIYFGLIDNHNGLWSENKLS